MSKVSVVYKKVDELIPYINNPRKNGNAVDAVASSIKNFGFKVPIVIDKSKEIINGHTRLKAAKKLGLEEVPVIIADDLTEAQAKAFRLADNKVAELSEWDFELLSAELEELDTMDLDFDISDFGDFDIDENLGTQTLFDKIQENPQDSNLKSTFILPPFSILDTRKKEWQDRKDLWKSLGIKSEAGRDKFLAYTESLSIGNLKGTSIFDPVLCEVGYRWFNVEGGSIVDPFAGGGVRGIVAEKLGYTYKGIDLRQEQIDANYLNANECGCDISKIKWYCDDSQNIDDYIEDNTMDLLFTCPPYYDLEQYSDNPLDISNMEYEQFQETYYKILRKASNKLKNNRFAIVVIGDVRDKNGWYRGLIEETKKPFIDAGFHIYNELILVNVVGSAAMVARKNMRNRKITKTHQNVLVFYKGDPSKIQEEFGILDNVDYDIEDL